MPISRNLASLRSAAAVVPLAFVCVAVLLLAGTAAADGPGVVARHGDKLSADVASAGDTDSFRVELSEGGRFDLSVKAGKGTGLLPRIRLFRPDGSEVAVGAFVKGAGGAKPALKKFVPAAGQTGSFRVVVDGGGTTGTYGTVFKVKVPKAVKAKKLAVAAAAVRRVEFTATAGAQVTVTVKEKTGGELASVRVLDPDGGEAVAAAAFVRKKSKLSVKKVVVPGTYGRYVVELTGAGGGHTVDVTVKAKFPKVAKRKVTLAPEADPQSLDPASVRQEDLAKPVALDGGAFLTGSDVTVSGEGVAVVSATFSSASRIDLVLDVAADAPFGLRNVTVCPPEELGEPVTLVDGLRIDAPTPTVNGLTPTTVLEDTQNQVFTVTGTGFRTGGRISFSGSGLAVDSSSVISDTEATVTVDVAADAGVGLRDVHYTQPAAGGADVGTGAILLRVNHPDPTLAGVAPTVLVQGDTDRTLTLTGSGFRTGGSVSVSGSGITVSNPSRVSDSTFTVQVTVAVDATFGDRSVTYAQPAVGGGADVVRAGAFAVNAPIPTVTDVDPGAVTRGDTDVVVTVTGSNFRAGGTVTFADAGLSVTDTSLLSDTRIDVTVDVATTTSVGLHGVTYAQPVAGGGAQAFLAGVLQVDARDPTVTTILATSVKQGDVNVLLTLTGTNFVAGGVISVGGAGLTVGATDVLNAQSATVTVSVDGDAAVGDRDVTFTHSAVAGGSSGTGDGLLAVHYPDPTVSVLGPDSVRRDDTGTLTLTGTGFRTGGLVGISGGGIALSSQTRVGDTTFTVAYDVDPAATLGDRDVTYTQPADGGGAFVTRTDGLEVFAAGASVTDVAPDAWLPGSVRFPVTITGQFFAAGDVVSVSGAGVTVHSTTVASATRITAVVSVAAGATLGERDLTITPTSGPATTVSGGVTVAPSDPTVTAFGHRTLARGASSVSVTVNGTNFRSGATLSASGSGVTFTSVTVVSATEITATGAVTVGATLGMRDLSVAHSVANGGRSGTLEDALDVIGAGPTVVSVNPATLGVTGVGGATRTVSARITGTDFMTGAAVTVTKSAGSGVTVVSGTTEVISGTRIDVDLAITGVATTGAWDVKVTNPGALGNSGTTGNSKLTLNGATTLTVNQVVPCAGSTYGGERVTIHGAGFVARAVVDFGAVRGHGTQVIDRNTIVTTVPQPAAVSRTEATEVTVKVTNPSSSNASRTLGYSYAKDEVTVVVKAQFPAQGATSVTASIAAVPLLLSVPADTTTATYGTADDSVNAFWFEAGGFTVTGGSRGFGPNGRFIVYARTAGTDLTATGGGQYVLSIPVGLKSVGGTSFSPSRLDNSSADQRFFTITTSTSDSTAPTLSTISPTNAATGRSPTTRVVLGFNEEIDPVTVRTSTITFKQGATTVAAHIEIAQDLKTVTLTPEAELATNTVYTTTVTTAVKDLSGNGFASAAARTFTTNSGTDTTAPTIDSVVIDSLPVTVDGSGTYVNSSGTGGNGFDLYLPRSGFTLKVTYSDEGGAGIDTSTFSAKSSVAVGASAANGELASNFDVSATGASWTVPSTSLVATGENVTFTFTVKDTATNAAVNKVVTVDVQAVGGTATGSVAVSGGTLGGTYDPFPTRETWLLRMDLDVYTATYSSQVAPAKYGATTSVASNNLGDFQESLRVCGLGTASMTTDAAATVNGLDTGTNAIVRRMAAERIRGILRERFHIDEDGVRDRDSVNIEFLLGGEQGSLTSLPTYSTANTATSAKVYSEMSVGATKGVENSAFSAGGTNGTAWVDLRNQRHQADVNDNGSVGVFALTMLKRRVNDGVGTPFGDLLAAEFVTVHGGAPVGEDVSDDDVLAGAFDRTTSGNATHNARYDAIFDGVELVALYLTSTIAHEIGHSLGAVANGPPKTGVFGNAHRDNTFTDATSTSANTAQHLMFAGVNNLMEPASSFAEATLTGTEFRKFNPLLIAHLRRRVLYDEGK